MGPQMFHFTTLPNGFPKWLSQGRTSSPSYTSPVFSSLKFLLISILWCSLGKTLLAFALLFFTPRSNLPITPGISWLPTFAFQSPIMKRTSFGGVISKRSCRTVQLLQHYWSGHKLGLPWYWMVCLGNEQRSFCRFWDCIQVLHFRLFCWLWWLLYFS